MKVKEVPQDLKYLKGAIVRHIDYAVDEDGKYQGVVSDGWTPKNEALEVTLDAVNDECEKILQRIRNKKTSPLEYHLVKNLMDVKLLSKYTGISKRTIRKHFTPDAFSELDDEILSKYASALRITVEQLKSIP